MPNELDVVKDSVRELQHRMFIAYAREKGDPIFAPLRDIATSIGAVAEMVPIYGRFLELTEISAPAGTAT